MLALPVLLIGLTIGVARWTNADLATREFATITPGAKHALNGLPPVATPVSPLLPAPAAATVPRQTSMPVLAAPIAEATPADSTPVSVPSAELETQFQLPLGSPPEAVAVAVDRTTPTPLNLGPFPKAALTSRPDETVGAVAADPDQHAAVAPPPIATAVLSPDRSVTAQDLAGGVDALAAGPTQCRIETEPPLSITWTPGNQESFGLALAAAARRQLKDFVIYNDRYTRLKYPMGDIHPMYGVCTDVIIRAYRALGLDLQELVQKTKSGSGDPNIDHRRVDTLRRFFSRFGESLPISTFAEDYRAGDIVTYWRPQNRHSRTHIAIVSDLTGPSGRPLIIHNRGWGPQQEDGLFVDEITGHYRFFGLTGPTEARGNGTTDRVPVDKPSNAGRTKETKPLRPVVRTGLTSTGAPRL